MAKMNGLFVEALGKYEFKAEQMGKVTETLESKLKEFDLSANSSFQEIQQKMEVLEQRKPSATAPRTILAVLEDAKDDLNALATNIKSEVFIDISATAKSDIETDRGQQLNEIGQLTHRKLPIRSLCHVVPMSDKNDNGIIRYSDWDSATTVRAAAAVAEGGTFPVSTAKFKKYSVELKKVGDTLVVDEEVFEDLESFAAEFEMFLETNLKIEEDTRLLRGTGEDDEITGLLTSATEFNYAAHAGTVQDASEYDLIVKCVEAISIAGGNKYMPNFCLMPTSLITKMMLKKDANNNYVLPPFMIKNADGRMVVANVAVIEENGFGTDDVADTNQLAIGDSRYMRLHEKVGISISRAAVGSQFTADMLTLKARMRELLLIKNADKSGFIKVSDVSTAISSLNTTEG